jgi:menaquinone-9 beta-reductase
MIETDVLIIGGGPAGAACAWALRRHGVDCLVLERATFPRVKLCAGWITPDVFRDLDLDPDDYPYGLTRLQGLRLSVDGLRLRLPSRQLAIRRTEFDDFLLKRAGVRVITHHAREIVLTGDQVVVDGAFAGRTIVGAGGTHCPVARTFFAETHPRHPHTLIVTQEEEFRAETADTDAARVCHLWFFEDGLPGYAWYVPKVDGYVNIGVGGKLTTLKARNDTIQRHWELLVGRIESLGLVRGHAFAPQGHAYYLRAPRREVRLGNAFVVGDAAGLATADMGEGIAPAIKSGLAAAAAIATGAPYTVEGIRRWSQPWPVAWLLARGYGRSC